MAGQTGGLFKGFKAGAAVSGRRIVKFGAADDTALQGAASTDAIFGVSAELNVPIGGNVDVQLSDIAEVVYGGAVTRGDLLTSDATGRAVAAAPGPGVNARTIGVAMLSGVENDIGAVHINPGRIQG